MRGKLWTLPALTALVSTMGLVGAFAASASADSITCEISGSIKLSPGLSESAQVQNISITKKKGAKLSACTGTETPVTGGNATIHMKTAEPVTCAALTGAGAPVAETNAVWKWQPKGETTTNSMSTFVMPLTEMSVPLEGTFAMGTFPFSEDTISGTVKQTYSGSCVSSGHKKAKKVNKGTFSGSITIS